MKIEKNFEGKDPYESLRLKTEKEEAINLLTGQPVYDKPDSHIHADVADLAPSLIAQMSANGEEFVGKTFEVADREWPSGIVEIDPDTDKIFMAQRVGRQGLSMFVVGREPKMINTVKVYLRRSDSYPDDSQTPVKKGYTVATVFAGDTTSREPWDSWYFGGESEAERTRRMELREKAIGFWSKNALIYKEGEHDIVPGTKIDGYHPESIENRI